MKKLIVILIIAIPLIFMWGCGNRKPVKEDNSNKEITMKEATNMMTKYLDDKYKTKHVVAKTKVDGDGPFTTLNRMSAEAYRSEDPSHVFQVYISFDGKKINDNYVTIPFTPKANKLYTDLANSIWRDIQVELTLGIGEPNKNWNENSDVSDFIANEHPGLESRIYISIKNYDKTTEIDNVIRFMKKLSDHNLNGGFSFIYIDNKDFQGTIKIIKKLSVDEILQNSLIKKCANIDFLPRTGINYDEIKNAFEK